MKHIWEPQKRNTAAVNATECIRFVELETFTEQQQSSFQFLSNMSQMPTTHA